MTSPASAAGGRISPRPPRWDNHLCSMKGRFLGEECGFEVSVPGAIRNRVPGDGSPFIPAPTDRTRWGMGDARDRCTNLIPFKWISRSNGYPVQMDKDTHALSHPQSRPTSQSASAKVSSPISSDYPHGEAATDQRHRAIGATAPERCARVLGGGAASPASAWAYFGHT